MRPPGGAQPANQPGGTSSNDPELLVEPPELLPVVLGRPNFRRDVAAIGATARSGGSCGDGYH